MGQADYFVLGDYNVACFECGRKRKNSTMKKHWKGYLVCPDHWEPRQPQDFVGTQPETSRVEQAQDQVDEFVAPFPEPAPYDPNDP